MSGRRVLLLSATMGAGHDATAAEIARRLTRRGDDVRTLDTLECLPAKSGVAIRGLYAGMLRGAPWLYQQIFQRMLDLAPGEVARIDSGPVERLAARSVRRVIREWRPDAVVPFWHIAAQAVGQLRADGTLAAPVTVVVTELAVHQRWVHDANDRHVCVHPAAAAEAAARGAADPRAAAPAIRPEFIAASGLGLPGDVEARLGGRLPVLVTAGAWGAGALREAAAAITADGRYAALVLCGRNHRLARSLAALPGTVPLGWRHDIPALLAGSVAVVQNGGGLACWEALALGRPVISFRPLPGHGRAAAERLERLGLAPWARTEADLLDRIDQASKGEPEPPRLDLDRLPDPAGLIL